MSPQASKSVSELKALVPVKIILPTKKYPWMMDVLHEIEYPCSNCTAAAGHQVFRKASESYLDPINGAGIYSTRLGVYCPDCKLQCVDYGFIQRGILDLMTVPPNFKAPTRAADPKAGGIFGDEDLDKDQPLVQPSAPQGAPAQAVAPAPVIPPKPEVALGAGLEMVYSESRGWHVIRTAEVLGDGGDEPLAGKPKKKPKRSVDVTDKAKAKAARLKARARAARTDK